MNPRIIRTEVDLALGSGTGETDVESLAVLGRHGRILAVKARLQTGGNATTATLYIADAGLTDVTETDELDVFYQSASFACTADDQTASWQDALTVPAPYAVDAIGDVRMVIDITAGSGASTFSVVVYAEVPG